LNPYRLPVSAKDVFIRQLAGREDLMLLEADESNTALALALLQSVTRPADGGALDFGDLPATDIDAALLRLRQLVFGDLVRSDVTCRSEGCGKRIDVEFKISDFLAHHAPRRARYVESAGGDEPGWYRLSCTPVTFRLPTGADLVAATVKDDPAQELVRRCVRPATTRGRFLRRVERALESMAPSLAQDLHAECAECRAQVEIRFDPTWFTLRELRDQAAFIYEDTHLLARHYHWPETEILALPRDRRTRYVEMLRQPGGAL